MKRQLTNTQTIALGFVLVIAFGTLLLMLPCSSRSYEWTRPVVAFFTAVSASCVTGLILVDTASHWSPFGQAVILILIQIGGLGFMTIATLFTRLLRHKLSLRRRAVLAESINASQIGRITAISKTILVGTAAVELTGAALLSIRFIPQFGLSRGIWYSVFHSVSAFCNAGFDLMGLRSPYSSFTFYRGDALVILTLSALILIGGIGFLVWDDILTYKRNVKKYSLHTKLTLCVTAILTVGGAVLFYVFEAGRMNRGLPVGDQVLISLFSSVTPRTAGFNSVDTAALSPASKMLTIILMFIGGSSGSTAGGIKTTTTAVIIISLISSIRGRKCVSVFHRRIGDEAISRAAQVASANLLLFLAGTLIILGAQDLGFTDVLFETVSAVSTVGMSTGVTRDLNTLSAVVVALLMYCGRVGSISFAMALLERRNEPPVKYPEEEIIVG